MQNNGSFFFWFCFLPAFFGTQKQFLLIIWLASKSNAPHPLWAQNRKHWLANGLGCFRSDKGSIKTLLAVSPASLTGGGELMEKSVTGWTETFCFLSVPRGQTADRAGGESSSFSLYRETMGPCAAGIDWFIECLSLQFPQDEDSLMEFVVLQRQTTLFILSFISF